MKRFTFSSWLASAFFLVSAADAHVSIVSGPALATTTQEIAFGVGHGCEGADTYSVRVEIPEAVTSVRTIPNAFGRASVELNASGVVTAVTWQKSEQDVLESDTAYYRLALRIKVPNQPFTKLYFPARQTCRTPSGTTSTVDWVATTPSDAGLEPAPELVVLPAHQPGWNKMTITQPGVDLATYFGDALIVWKGQSAYSANPATAEMIGTTDGVAKLTELAIGDELWVKY